MQHSQQFIDEILHFTYAYIDNVLVASDTSDEHAQHRSVFHHFQQYSAIINPLKYECEVNGLQFLRHHIYR